MASLSVADPVATGTTLPPSILMRKTLSDCRLQSSAPMYTVRSMPISAQAVAVATPCWPAPVSQMMRFFPRRFARSACPMALLILCAPVCARSSRFSQICAPPIFSVSRFAWYVGVGPPMYSFRYLATSAMNSGSLIAMLYCRSSSSCASTSVSGMYRPPNAPNAYSGCASTLDTALGAAPPSLASAGHLPPVSDVTSSFTLA
mmetsp:Transcript_48185/g.96436  ORF Transcript_48185/g.96436 Transcript_48185/m.96436 type:complete len:203 (-) Transcript_48185:349-957(-)